jgi:signal transduction histidine kinase
VSDEPDVAARASEEADLRAQLSQCQSVIALLQEQNGRLEIELGQLRSADPSQKAPDLSQLIIEHSPIGIAVCDGKDLRVKWANLACRQFLDEPYRAQVDVAGLRVEDFIPQALETGAVRAMRHVVRKNEPLFNLQLTYDGFERGRTYWQFALLPLPAEEAELSDVLILATEVTEQVLKANAELQLSREQLQVLSRRLVESLENERRTIAQELHDESSQALTVLKLGLAQLRRATPAAEETHQRIEELERIVAGVMENLHRLSRHLRPASLDRYGLVAALEQFTDDFQRQSGLHIDFVTAGLETERLPSTIETALYRIVQEAVTNAARHAEATHVGVIVEKRGERAVAIIEDNGRGFDVEEALRCGRLGLLGMRERAEMLGGTLTIESEPGTGTALYVHVDCSRGGAV